MTFADKNLVCRDCNGSFLFTVGEQEFYKSRGLLNEPSRCPDCRSARRQERNGFSKPREKTQVTCASCGIQTEVPFQPRTGRPVYCEDCFAKVRNQRPA